MKVLGFPLGVAAAWTVAAGACLAHVAFVWYVSPRTVSSTFLGAWSPWWWRNGLRWLAGVLTACENWLSRGIPWYFWVLARAAFFLVVQGPLDVAMDVLGDPDSARMFAACVLAPLLGAALCFVAFGPHAVVVPWLASSVLPEGWVAADGSPQSIAWVAAAVGGGLCFLLQLLEVFHPPLLHIVVGRQYGDGNLWKLTAPIAAAVIAAAVFAGVHVDGRRRALEDDGDLYDESRDEFVAYLFAATTAVVAAVLVSRSIL